MASISKLALRGIRSFSPDDDDQLIDFYFPCTIIVGANGCGKTTIIEALKYAVTGALPPGGAKSGQAFVHDPKSFGHSVVKANVKLRFSNLAGTTMVVIRSMEVTQKKSTMTFKALDGVLKTTDPNTGQRLTLSHKCTELDRQIPMLLGVSRPILENVVFCHQEESSWPLMEGAVLKKRFDDIFDSARYAKALEVIRKLCTDYRSKVKDLKADLAGLAGHQHAAHQHQVELTRVHKQMDEIDDTIQDGKRERIQVDQTIAECNDILTQSEDVRQEMEMKRNEYANEKSVLDTQKSLLEDNLTKKHGLTELQDMLRDFDDQRSGLTEEKLRVEKRCQALRQDIQSLQDDLVRLNGHAGKLTAAKEGHEQHLMQRLSLMQGMARKYGIDIQVTPTQQQQPPSPQQQQQQDQSFASQESYLGHHSGGTQESSMTLSDDDMNAFYEALDLKERELRCNLTSNRDMTQAQEDQVQRSLSELLGKQTAIESARNKVQKEYADASRELQQFANTARTSRVREGEISERRKEADSYAKQRDDLVNKGRREEIETSIKQLERKIEDLKIGIARDNEALQYLRGRVEKQSEICMLREQATEEISSFKLKIDATRYEFRQRDIEIPTVEIGALNNGRELVESMSDLVRAVDDKHRGMRDELERVDRTISTAQQTLSEKTALLNHNQQTVESLRRRIDALQSSSGGVGIVKDSLNENLSLHVEGFDISRPQQTINLLEQKIQTVDDNLSKVDKPHGDTVNALEKLGEMMSNEGENVCPCCQRTMIGSEMKKYVETMTLLKDKERSPLVLQNKVKAQEFREQKLKLLTTKRLITDNMNDLLDHVRLVEESGKLGATLPTLRRDVVACEANLQGLRNARRTLSSDVETLRNLLDTANNFFQDASRISAKMIDIDEKVKDEETAHVGTGSYMDTRSLATVESELFERLKKKDQMSDEISEMNKEMSNLNNEITSLTTKASNLDKRVRELEQLHSKAQEDAKRKDALQEKCRSCEEEEKKLRSEINTLQQKIDSKETEKRRLRAAAKDEEDQLTQILNKFTTDMSDLKSLTSQINRYIESNQSDEFGKVSADISSAESRIKDKQDDLQTTIPTLNSLTKTLDDQERHKKNLKANIDILKLEKRLVEINKAITKLENEVDDIENEKGGGESLRRALHESTIRKQKLNEQISGLEGQQRELRSQEQSIKRKLVSAEYKDIDERHATAMIMHNTTRDAVSDLEKYYDALDKALLRYHSIKVQEINKIIRELWCLTYKGEDINSIEVVTSPEGASKRSYNYRVVMTKGNAQLDMRGRCSAGQRVLASIVIRLALAETFCVNFGCLALDEPTTNLDHQNKAGLAKALAQIIASRSKQSNFQLVIITHDEDFVSMMKSELSSQTGFDMPEKYFHVRREEGSDGKFYSKIDAVDWDQLT